MSIERYVKFISEQAINSGMSTPRLNEASKKGRYSLNKIKDKHYHLEYDGGPSPGAIAKITHVPPETPDGKYKVRLEFKGTGPKGIDSHTQDFPATGTNFEGPHLRAAVRVAIARHRELV